MPWGRDLTTRLPAASGQPESDGVADDGGVSEGRVVPSSRTVMSVCWSRMIVTCPPPSTHCADNSGRSSSARFRSDADCLESIGRAEFLGLPAAPKAETDLDVEIMLVRASRSEVIVKAK